MTCSRISHHPSAWLSVLLGLALVVGSLLPAAPSAFAQAPSAAPNQASSNAGSALLSPASPSAAGETCVVLQPGPAAAKDAYIKQERPDDRMGTNNELRVKTENKKLLRSLLQFDLSSIPSTALVNSATLSLWVKSVSGANTTINAHEVTNTWNETQVTWKARDKAAKQNWTTQGGDYNAAVLGTAALTAGAKNVWATWSVKDAAQNWVTTPANNRGVIIEAPVADPKSEAVFKSSDDGTANQRPKLEVCYGASVSLTPDNQGTGVTGQQRIYSHVLHVGNLTSVFNLTVASNKGWTTIIYKDVNGDGVKDP
jgi:hypothetical protein